MNVENIIDLFQYTMHVVIIIMCAVMVPGLVVGLVISIFQAATQISEQSLSFIPKLFVTFMALGVFSAWIIKSLVDLYEYVMSLIPLIVS